MASILLVAIVGFAGCDDATGPEQVVSVSITPADTTILAGDPVTFEAIVEYHSGPGLPDSVVWSVSDVTVLSGPITEDGKARVIGLERGEAYVIAVINDEFVDSAEVTVVRPGDVRWRVEDPGFPTASGPAIDERGRVYTVRIDGAPGTLSAVTSAGLFLFSAPACWSDLSGSVLPDGTAYTTRADCLQRHTPDGSVEWRVECGSSYGGVAVDGSGSVACLEEVLDPVSGIAEPVLIRISSDGTELWRVTLGQRTDPTYRAAPVIASNGDIYVPWNADSYSENRLSRVTANGTVVWTVPSPGFVDLASPALTEDRVVVSHEAAGVAVFDTSGALIWAETWNPVQVSSPVVDADGNIYVQSTFTLVSFTADGALRWSADSLRSVETARVGAPTLLTGEQLLVTCRNPGQVGDELCAVNAADGSLLWRSAIGSHVEGSPAVASDGTIYTTTNLELIALWSRVPPLSEGWPTGGGGMGRLRSQ